MHVTAVIPCYNAALYLGEALDSACAQVPAPAEILVVDDGSTDDSVAVAERFGARVRCDRQPHRGISATRNRGVELARGEVVAFLDADDRWPAGSIDVRIQALAADPSAGCAYGLVEEFLSPDVVQSEAPRYQVVSHPVPGRMPTSTLIRREVFARVGSFNPAYQLGEMLDWVSRADAAGVRFTAVDRVVTERRVHRTNTGIVERNRRGDYLRVLRAAVARNRR